MTSPQSTVREFIGLVDRAHHKRRALNREKSQAAKRVLIRELRDLDKRVGMMLDVLIAPSLPLQPIVQLEESDRQVVLLALAVLSLHRPGWEQYLRTVSDHFAGETMFESLRVANADLYKADPVPFPKVVQL